MLRHALMAAALTLATAPAALASWVTQDANLRSGPGTNHHVRAVLTVCTRVDVEAHHAGWLRVDSLDGHGWVRARFVSDHRPRACGRIRDDVTHFDGLHLRPRVHIWIGSGYGHWVHDDVWDGHDPIRRRIRDPIHPFETPRDW